MSEFDKEAERERLREKFARDEEKRADTKRMSELLLKGATMTNRHCDTCGDPIFRHEDQEFCATCQGRAAEAASEVPGDDAEAGDVDGALAADEPPAATADAEATREASDADAAETAAAERPTAPDRVNGRTTSTARQANEGGRDAGTTSTGEPADTARTPTTEDGTLGDAHASLVRTLAKHAAAAEGADDPRVAKDHLAAAREAAETLRALDGR